MICTGCVNIIRNNISSVLLIILFFILSTKADAQYFGRNKVQYQTFNFEILKTEHFDLYFYPEEKEAVKDAAIMLERWDYRYSKIFDTSVGKDQPIILYANHPDFEQTNVVSGLISQATGGVTEGLENRITLPFTGVYKENNHVLGHELVHAFQYNLIKAGGHGLQAAGSMPIWFIEGLAEYLSIGRKDALTAMWMRDAVLNNDVPDISDVSTNYKYFPYRYGQILWAFITTNYGDDIIKPLIESVIKMGWDKGFKEVLKVSQDSLSKMWKQDIYKVYADQIKGRTKPSETGKQLISGNGGMNLSPVISPDGQYIALFTRENLFTLNLFLADASTGKLINELVSTNTDAHFDALRFMNSSGTWSPDDKYFAFVVMEDGNDQIAILDVDSKDISRKLNPGEVDAVTYLSWSPDGNKILFSGTIGGINDLFIYDLENDHIRRLTNNKYAELQPDWSPDGIHIVFATDKGKETSFKDFQFNSMNLEILNVENNKSKIISIDDGVKHINPHYSPDGKSIYFISDPDGISNIYRHSLENGNFYKLTNIATGISGLTALSPALSISSQTGELVFNVFNKTEYNINSIDPDTVKEVPVIFNLKKYEKTISLPLQSKSNVGIVEKYFASKAQGLVSDTGFVVKNYSPFLSLIAIAQSGVGISFSNFGTELGGGINMLFSDMLGNNLLSATVFVNGTYKDIGGQAVYWRQGSRINWGGAVGHIPYLTGYVTYNLDTVNVNGNQVLAEDVNIYRQRVFSDRLSLLGAYPFSQNRRLEASIGFQRISYNFEVEKIVQSSGYVFNQSTTNLEAPSGLNLFNTSLSYVGDYSFFGFTSPVDGSRYRFEVEPTLGSLTFLTAILDYRKYFFFNPFTLAFRGMHYGRYLKDADNQNLFPFQLGFDTWVRGYNINSFNASECTGDVSANGRCIVFDRLIGSRVAIFNMEFRVPLFGTEQFGLINFGFLPTEISLFLDGGVAWTSDEPPVFEIATRSSKRIPVFSSGVAARFNLFGYIVTQLYYAYPFQRPDAGWQFGFVLAPGW